MSGQPDETRPPPPRRPKPAATPNPGSDPVPEGANVYRPNPKRTAGANGSKTVRELGPGEPPGLWERFLYGRVGSGQLANFCRQLAAYLNAGVDFQKALGSLQKQFDRTALGPVIGRIQVGIKRGQTLTESAKNEPQAFDTLFVSMIRVAEERGGVPETLRHLGRHYEARQRLIRQARSAMIYPIAVLLVASAVVAFLTIWLLPMFVDLIRDISGPGATLPLPSRILMAFSSFVRSIGWLVLPLLAIGTPIVLFRTYRTAAGKAVMDRIALRIPVFGPLLRKIDTSRFARTLGALLGAGIDIGSSLELTADVLQLNPMREAIRDSKIRVMQGSELSVALAGTRRFGPDVIAVVNSGEETGKLPESLDHLADDYEEQVTYTVKNLGQLVQPLLLIFLGGIVLFIILAVFLPYLSMLTSLSKP